MTEKDRPPPRVGKRMLLNNPEYYSFVHLVNDQRVSLSLHDSPGNPGHFWLTTQNLQGEFLPARLALDEVRALRDGCNLILEDAAPPVGDADV